MSRTKTAITRHQRKKRIFRQARGYRGGRSKLYRTARESVMRSLAYSYRDRKVRKRDFRRLWITRIRAGLLPESLSYSVFMDKLRKADVRVNRKILAELAVHQPGIFSRLVREVKK
jgi:large subunit ribosomal protein L20